jgi:predicted RNA polymerase sigma factor
MYDLRARRLSAIAATYRSLGILSQAREFYEQALRLAQDEQMRAQIREELERIP